MCGTFGTHNGCIRAVADAPATKIETLGLPVFKAFALLAAHLASKLAD